jgi:hypothetical protein
MENEWGIVGDVYKDLLSGDEVLYDGQTYYFRPYGSVAHLFALRKIF